jgi:hypothetical protein
MTQLYFLGERGGAVGTAASDLVQSTSVIGGGKVSLSSLISLLVLGASYLSPVLKTAQEIGVGLELPASRQVP